MSKCADIGGQAVIEGVMMRSPDWMGIAVRKSDGTIVTSREETSSPAKKHPFLGWPFIRGIVNMVLMLYNGMHTIDIATKMLGIEDEEPSRFEKWISKKLGKSVDKVVMGTAIVFAVGLALLLFMVIPNAVATALNTKIHSLFLVNLLSGIVRITILVLYIGLTGLIPDMRRTYQYHGAEHKTVYCNEAGLELTPANARKFSKHHPRCGTSFLLLVMIIAVLLGAVSDQLIGAIFSIEKMSFAARLLRSLCLLPIVAGFSYEALKALAHSEKWYVKALRWPGMQLQRLTTREPDDSMLEVAIEAMKIAKGEAEPTCGEIQEGQSEA